MADPHYHYEPIEAFGESLTTRRPWNTSALEFVERLNGRTAMVGFAAAFRPSLNKHEMERLARIQRQSVQKHHAQRETVMHMQEIRRRQRKEDYENEYDNLRAATVHGGLA